MQVAEGVEGMIHVSEISAEKRINHPQDVLKVGQIVQAQVLAIDTERRLMRLSMKQLVPTSIDEYIAEHKMGDVVTGRVMNTEGQVRVELGEGIQALCRGEAAASPAALRLRSTIGRQSRHVIARRDVAVAMEGRRARRDCGPSRNLWERSGAKFPDHEARCRSEEHRG